MDKEHKKETDPFIILDQLIQEEKKRVREEIEKIQKEREMLQERKWKLENSSEENHLEALRCASLAMMGASAVALFFI